MRGAVWLLRLALAAGGRLVERRRKLRRPPAAAPAITEQEAQLVRQLRDQMMQGDPRRCL